MSGYFTLGDVYRFADTPAKKHPHNRNIKAKIRQQLQLLRDKGVIEFISRGYYAKIGNFSRLRQVDFYDDPE